MTCTYAVKTERGQISTVTSLYPASTHYFNNVQMRPVTTCNRLQFIFGSLRWWTKASQQDAWTTISAEHFLFLLIRKQPRVNGANILFELELCQIRPEQHRHARSPWRWRHQTCSFFKSLPSTCSASEQTLFNSFVSAMTHLTEPTAAWNLKTEEQQTHFLKPAVCS